MKKAKKVLSLVLAVIMLVSAVSINGITATSDSAEIKVGDEIEFGSYPQSAIKDENGNVTGYNDDPIKWRVLKIENGKALLFSSLVLDWKCYNTTSATINGYYGNNYEHSSIRKWLVNDFYDTAFSSLESECIIKTTLDNSACATDFNASGHYSQYSSKSTDDKVFLLSKYEADNYASKYLKSTATSYAVNKGHSGDGCLLRTAGNNTFQIYYIQYKWGAYRTYFNWYDDTLTASMGVRPAIYIDLKAYDEHVNGKFLEGYDEDTDQYIFLNQTSKIDYSHYCKMFSPLFANDMLKDDDGTGGQCYGMATTTSLFFQNNPPVNSVLTNSKNSEAPSYAEYLKNMWNDQQWNNFDERYTSYIDNYKLYLNDFIKYAHISQYGIEVVLQKRMTINKYDQLLKAVENYIDGGIPVIIGIRGDLTTQKNCGHAILPVGIKKTETQYIVYVDDSNKTEDLQELIFNIENGEIMGWSYDSLNWGSNKPNGKIYFNTPDSMLTDFYTINALNTEIKNFFEDVYKLLSVESENCVIKDDDQLLEIMTENGEAKGNDLYWVDETFDTITISAVDEEASFTLSDDYTGVSATIPVDSEAKCMVDDEIYSNIVIYNVLEKDIEFSVLTADEDDFITVIVTGTATEDKVTATQTATGIEVTGIANGTVTLTKNDEVIATQSIICSDGKTEINYDKTGENTELTLDYTEKHAYTSTTTEPTCTEDGYTTYNCSCGDTYSETIEATGHKFDGLKCINCDYEKTKDCTCGCHKNRIIDFFYTVVDLIFSIFGGNFDCACGKSHF